MNKPSTISNENKNTIKLARKELTKSPPKYRERRKSSIPLKLVEFIRNNELNQIKPDPTKNSYKGAFSSKKNFLKEMININIPEESDDSSNKKEKKNKKIKKTKRTKKEKKEKKEKHETKNEIENNNYYIHYIKNIYENEHHLNKENIFKSANKENNDIQMKLMESNKNLKKFYKRRNSALNRNLLKSNINNINLILDKEQINKKFPLSIISKKKSAEIGSFLHKNNLDEKKKDITKSYYNKNSNRKNKSKHKSKEKKKNKEKDKELDKNQDNNDENILNDDNRKKSENTNKNDKEILENEKKTEIESNNKNSKIRIKKIFCCFINDGDSSIEND